MALIEISIEIAKDRASLFSKRELTPYTLAMVPNKISAKYRIPNAKCPLSWLLKN